MITNQTNISITEDLQELEKFSINPMFYAHVVIMHVIKAPHLAFINGNDKAGIMSIILGVDQLERICKAEGVLEDKQYDADISKLTEDEKAKPDSLLKDAKIANAKLQILLKLVFKKKTQVVDIVI